MQFSTLNRPTQTFIVACTVLAAAFLGTAWIGYSPAPWRDLLVYLLLVSVAGARRVHLTPRLGTMSVGFAVVMAALLRFGPAEGMLTALVGGIAGSLISQRTKKFQPLHRIVFAMATLVLSAGASSAAYTWCGGQFGRLAWGENLAPMIVTSAVYYLVNTWIVALVSALAQESNPWTVWHDSFLWTAPGYFAGASTAVLVNLLYQSLGLAGFAIAIPPLYITYYSYRIYMEKLQQDILHIEELQGSSEKLAQLYLSTIQSLALAIDAKDRYTHLHILRVQEYAVDIAQELELSEEDLEGIRTGALLHDVGKLGIPEHILSKPGKLSGEEYRKIQQHPSMGAEILQPIDFPWPVMHMVRHHHEWWNGKGYPDGLKEEGISLGARILAVADVFDALTSDRSYRKAWSVAQAVELVLKSSSTQFDPTVVEAFIRVVARREGMSEEELFASVERLDPVEEASRVASTVTRDADKHTVLHDIAKAHQEMYALYEISQNIGTTLGLQETATLITTKMGHIVDCNTCVLYLLDSNYSELEARGAVGQFAAAFERLHLALGDGPTGWAVAQRQPVVNGEAYHDLHGSRAGDEAAELESALAFPLIPEDEGVIGCLTLYHTKREAFTEDDLRMLSMVGRRAAMAVKNALTFEETRASALTDGITGLANSRYYFMCVEHEFSRAAREGLPLSLVVVDLDNFKEVNDNFGHAIGDQVLRDMARLLREQVRDRDTVVRYGGDEFFVVLPETNRAAAEKIAHRIEDAAARYSLQPRTDKRISVGLSIGVATYPDDSTEANELLRIADDRMYQVKHIHRQPLRLVA